MANYSGGSDAKLIVSCPVLAVALLGACLIVGGWILNRQWRPHDEEFHASVTEDCGDVVAVPAYAPPPRFATPCTYCTVASSGDCKICIQDNPRLEVGADGLATEVLHVCNAGDQPVKLALSVSDFSFVGLEINPLPLNTTRKISAETTVDKPVVEEGANLETSKCVNAKLEVGKLWQAGPMTASLRNAGAELVKLVALCLRVPFAIKVDGRNPEALDFSVRRGYSATIGLRNDDSTSYRFRWRLELGEHVLKDGAAVAPTGASELRVKLDDAAYGRLESGFLRPAKLQVRLILRHEPDPGFRHLPGDSRSILMSPVELEGLAQLEGQRHEGAGADELALFASSLADEVGQPRIATFVALARELHMQCAGGSALVLGSACVDFQRLRERHHERRQLGRHVAPPVLRCRPLQRLQPRLDRVARQARELGDLADRLPVAHLHAANLAYQSHGDHLCLPCLKSREGRLFTLVNIRSASPAGQFSDGVNIFDHEHRLGTGYGHTTAQQHLQALEHLGGQARKVGQSALANLAVLAVGLAKQDRGRRVSVGNRLDVHGQRAQAIWPCKSTGDL
jgi:hypothetical protein